MFIRALEMLCSSKSDRDDFLFPKTARQGYPIWLKRIDFSHTGYNNPPKLGIYLYFFFGICILVVSLVKIDWPSEFVLGLEIKNQFQNLKVRNQILVVILKLNSTYQSIPVCASWRKAVKNVFVFESIIQKHWFIQ